jgi:hypothetical protein
LVFNGLALSAFRLFSTRAFRSDVYKQRRAPL